MKTPFSILIILLLSSSSGLLAQESYPIDKGSVLIGGSAGFSSSGTEGSDRWTRITATPSLSYFVIPNLAIGGNGSYSRSSFSGGSSFTTVGIGPTIAYYHGDGDIKSYPFLSSNLMYVRELDLRSHIQLRFSTGVAVMVAKNVAITTAAFFSLANRLQDGPDQTSNAFGIEIGISTFIF